MTLTELKADRRRGARGTERRREVPGRAVLDLVPVPRRPDHSERGGVRRRREARPVAPRGRHEAPRHRGQLLRPGTRRAAAQACQRGRQFGLMLFEMGVGQRIFIVSNVQFVAAAYGKPSIRRLTHLFLNFTGWWTLLPFR